MARDERVKCGTCVFHEPGDGTCKLFPPQVAGQKVVETYSVFPSVADGDWCGAWKDVAAFERLLNPALVDTPAGSASETVTLMHPDVG